GDLLLTAYAYFADWRASRALGVELGAAHWRPLLDAYQKTAGGAPLLHRALAVWMMQQMELPAATLLEGVQRDLAQAKFDLDAAPDPLSSVLMADDPGRSGDAVALLLWRDVARHVRDAPDAQLAAHADAVERALRDGADPLLAALAEGM